MRFTIILLLLMTSPCVMAERINFVNISRQLSNNEIINSPVHTKKLFRQMYEEDKAAYDQQMTVLAEQKKAGTISSRTYLYRTEALRNAFKKAYPKSLAEQGKQIEQTPVDMWMLVAFSNHRRDLIRLTHPQYRQIMKDTISGKNLTASKEAPSQSSSNTSQQNKNMSVQKVKNTQKLGRKSFSINTDAFK